jgi:hypothetical protein
MATITNARAFLHNLIGTPGTVQRAAAGNSPAVLPVSRINPYFPTVPNLPSLPFVVGSSNSNIPPRLDLAQAGRRTLTAIGKSPNSLFIKPTGK